MKLTKPKKLLTVLLAITMVMMTMLPTVTFAEDTTISSEEELKTAISTASMDSNTPTTITVRGTIYVSSKIELSDMRYIKIVGTSKDDKIIASKDFNNDLYLFHITAGQIEFGNITLDGNDIVRVLHVGNKGSIILSAGSHITKGFNKSLGGGVCLGGTATLIMNEDSLIDECMSGERGGAIYLGDTCNFTMNGGTIMNCSVNENVNSSGYGGAIAMWWGSGATFTMNGGEITENRGRYIGGICAKGIESGNRSVVNLNGGKIYNNFVQVTTYDYARDLFVGDNVSLNIGKDASIYNNNVDIVGSSNYNMPPLSCFKGFTVTSALTGKIQVFASRFNNQNVVAKGTESYTLTQSDLSSIEFITDKYGAYLDSEKNQIISTNNISVVTFNANTGEDKATSIQKVLNGKKTQLNANPFTYSGYRFIDWNTERDGSGTSYKDKDTITTSSDMTLYAQWEEIQGTKEDPWDVSANGEGNHVIAYLEQNNKNAQKPTYTLIVSGRGKMEDYANVNSVPWHTYLESCITIGVIEEGVTHLGARTFVLGKKLDSVILPESLESIGISSFNQSSLTSITFPGGLKEIGNYAFYQSALSGQINIPENVTTIGDHAFNQSQITGVTLPSGLTSLGGGVFNGTKLTSMPEIPLGITSLSTVFQNCAGITEIVIPTHVTILDRTFMGCTGLTTVTIPETVESYVGAFNGCTGLVNAIIESKTDNIGGSNTNLATGVFGDCINLKTVSVPKWVKVIGMAAFRNCSSLETTDFIERATSIKAQAFQGCTSLKGSLNLSASTIGNLAFDKCSNLGGNISVANTISIGDNAFRDCSEINGIVYAQVVSGGANKFSSKSVTAILNGGIFSIGTNLQSNTLATPIKDGYKFDGWYDNDSFTGNVITTPETGKTYYAKWTEKVDQLITYENATVEKHINSGTFTNELTQTTVDGEITYISSNEDVATVNGTTGEVIIVGTGTATITATVAETDTHKKAVAEYTLTVTDHSYVKHNAVPATHKSDGIAEHYTCENCNLLFDMEKHETTLRALVIAKLDHDFSDGWKNDGINHWHECECGDKSSKLAHTFEWVIDKEATETENGSKHKECTVCSYKKVAVEIPAIGGDIDKPFEPSKPDTDAPQTGDNRNMLLWIFLMAVSATSIGTILIVSKRRIGCRGF